MLEGLGANLRCPRRYEQRDVAAGKRPRGDRGATERAAQNDRKRDCSRVLIANLVRNRTELEARDRESFPSPAVVSTDYQASPNSGGPAAIRRPPYPLVEAAGSPELRGCIRFA